MPFLSPREVLSVGLDFWNTVQSRHFGLLCSQNILNESIGIQKESKQKKENESSGATSSLISLVSYLPPVQTIL